MSFNIVLSDIKRVVSESWREMQLGTCRDSQKGATENCKKRFKIHISDIKKGYSASKGNYFIFGTQ